jgi:outer membrane protein
MSVCSKITRQIHQCAIVGALVVFAAVHPAAAKPSGLPTKDQIANFESVDEVTRVKLLIHLSKSGQAELAAELLRRYPLQGKHAANRTLFIEGLVLKSRGDLTGAAQKFRDALAHDPSLTLVRSELAQTLVTLEQDDSAKYHLNMLAADAPTEQASAGIRSFIDKIDERRPYKFNAYLAIAPTTNVNNGSSHSTVYSPIFGSNLTIGQASQKSSGIGGAVGANVAFNKRLGNDFSFVAAGNGELRIYDDSDFNAVSLSQSAELRYLIDRGYVGFGAVSSQSLDDDTLDLGYISYGPRISARFGVTPRDTLTGASVYEWRDPGSGSSKSTAWMTDAAWTHAIGSAASVTVTAGYDDVRLDLAQNSYDSWSAGLSLFKEFPMGISANLSGEVKLSEFDDVNLIAGVTRADERYVGGVGLTKRDVNLFGFAPELNYTYVRNVSNISLYDYDSHSVDFRLTKDF